MELASMELASMELAREGLRGGQLVGEPGVASGGELSHPRRSLGSPTAWWRRSSRTSPRASARPAADSVR